MLQTQTIDPHDHIAFPIFKTEEQIRRLPPQVEFGDLLSYNYMLMHRAAEKFDESLGFAWSTYAGRAMEKNISGNTSRCLHYGFCPSRPKTSRKFRQLRDTQSHSHGHWGFVDEKAPDPAAQAEDADTLAFLKAQVSEDDWAVVEAVVVHGDTYEKAAKRWGVSRETLRNRYIRIVKRLQEEAVEEGLMNVR